MLSELPHRDTHQNDKMGAAIVAYAIHTFSPCDLLYKQQSSVTGQRVTPARMRQMD